MQLKENKIIKKVFIYIVLFTIVICIVGSTESYFHNNLNNLSLGLNVDSELSTLNLYFLKVTKTDGVTIKKYGLAKDNDLTSYYITFENKDKTENTFIKLGDILYFNKIKLCEHVEEFIVSVDNSTNQSIFINIKILGQNYEFQYAID